MTISFSASGTKDAARTSLSSQMQAQKQAADPAGREAIDQIGAALIRYLDSLGDKPSVSLSFSGSVGY